MSKPIKLSIQITQPDIATYGVDLDGSARSMAFCEISQGERRDAWTGFYSTAMFDWIAKVVEEIHDTRVDWNAMKHPNLRVEHNTGTSEE